jgi:hypothetical protein
MKMKIETCTNNVVKVIGKIDIFYRLVLVNVMYRFGMRHPHQ